jgi:hypothetical protein
MKANNVTIKKKNWLAETAAKKRKAQVKESEDSAGAPGGTVAGTLLTILVNGGQLELSCP